MSNYMSDNLPASAGGIDLGGTKIESTLFGRGLEALDTRRRATPNGDYGALLDALADEIDWLRAASGNSALPVGIGIPGLVDPQTGISLTANLPANGKPLSKDLRSRVGGTIVTENDCKCFALSEARGGAGGGYARVFGLVLGTGLGGGLCQDGRLVLGANGLPGEVGHYALPAHLIAEHDLPVLECGCGRRGCTETLISGTGISRLAKALTGTALSGQELAASSGDPQTLRVLGIWTELAAELLHTIQLHLDPECIVLGGGLSNLPGLEGSLAEALRRVALSGVRRPEILKPKFGDSSGGRGAALIALSIEEGT